MVGHVKRHVWLCVSAFSTSTRRARAAHRSAERLRRRTIERVNNQEQIGRIEQAPALRCSEGAVHLAPGAEGRECDGGHGMSQRKGLVRVHPGGKGVAEKSVPGEAPAAGPYPPRSAESAETGPSRGAAPVATPAWSSPHAEN